MRIMFRVFHIAVLGILIYPLLTLVSSAQLEQRLTSINAHGKKATLTLFHFNTYKTVATITPVSETVGNTIQKYGAAAGISIPSNAGITVTGSKLSFNSSAKYLFKAGKRHPLSNPSVYGKHTFILTNNKGAFVLGYAPFTSSAELSYALAQYIKSSKAQYQTAVLLNSGNSSAFYKNNGNYLAYYLKELNPAKQVLMVK